MQRVPVRTGIAKSRRATRDPAGEAASERLSRCRSCLHRPAQPRTGQDRTGQDRMTIPASQTERPPPCDRRCAPQRAHQSNWQSARLRPAFGARPDSNAPRCRQASISRCLSARSKLRLPPAPTHVTARAIRSGHLGHGLRPQDELRTQSWTFSCTEAKWAETGAYGSRRWFCRTVGRQHCGNGNYVLAPRCL